MGARVVLLVAMISGCSRASGGSHKPVRRPRAPEAASAAPATAAVAATTAPQHRLVATPRERGAHFGHAVAQSQSSLVIGSPGHQPGGAVYIFEGTGSSMKQQLLAPPFLQKYDAFGDHVAIDNDLALVTAPYRKIAGAEGFVFTFKQTPQGWVQSGSPMHAPGSAQPDRFGSAIALSGASLLVGAPERHTGGRIGQGAAYIFQREGEVWTSHGPPLVASDGQAEDRFGLEVALDQDLAIVSAVDRNVDGHKHAGAVYVFERTALGWTQRQVLTAQDGDADEYFGSAIAVSGNSLLISSYLHTVGTSFRQGAVYPFFKDGAEWIAGPILTASDGGDDDRFGYAIAMDGNRAIIGDIPYKTGHRSNRGAAYVFERHGRAWLQKGDPIEATDGNASDDFGTALSIRGTTAVIGASQQGPEAEDNPGAAYMLRLAAEE